MCYLIVFIKFLQFFISEYATYLLAYAAYKGGSFIYYRQKEYELAQKRYLFEGIDQLSQLVDNELFVYRYNWSKSLLNIKYLVDFLKIEDLKNNEKKHKNLLELLDEKLKSFNSSAMQIIPNYRTKILLDSYIIWKISQSFEVFCKTSNTIMCSDLKAEIELVIKNKESPTKPEYDNYHPKQVIDNYRIKLEELNEKSKRFHQFLASLQDIAFILERKKFSFKGIIKFHESNEVKKIIDNLKAIFPEFANDNESV